MNGNQDMPAGVVNKSHIGVTVLIFIVGIAVGAFVSFYFYSPSSYQAGFDAARNLVENSSVGGVFRTPDDIRILSGTVTAINGTSITLHTVSNNPFDDPSLNDRIILVASSTKIFEFTQKDPKVFQSEVAAFTKTAQSASSTSPTFFSLTATDLTRIKVGDALSVTALKNIKSVKEFTASEIQIQSQLSLMGTSRVF